MNKQYTLRIKQVVNKKNVHLYSVVMVRYMQTANCTWPVGKCVHRRTPGHCLHSHQTSIIKELVLKNCQLLISSYMQDIKDFNQLTEVLNQRTCDIKLLPICVKLYKPGLV